MEEQRKIKFKAWNTESRLMMRLSSIPCLKGALISSGHILLEFTGCHDKEQEEIYEHDIVLRNSIKYRIVWDGDELHWDARAVNEAPNFKLTKATGSTSMRLGSALELA